MLNTLNSSLYIYPSLIIIQLIIVFIIFKVINYKKKELFFKNEEISNSNADDIENESDEKENEEGNSEEIDSFDEQYKEYYENLKKENQIIERNYSNLYKKVTSILERRKLFSEGNKLNNLLKHTYYTYGKRRIILDKESEVKRRLFEKLGYIYGNFYDPYYNRKYFFGSFYDYKYILTDPRRYYRKKGFYSKKKLHAKKKKKQKKENKYNNPTKPINKNIFYNVLLNKYPKHVFEFLGNDQVRVYHYLRNIVTYGLNNIYYKITGYPYSSAYIYWGTSWFDFITNNFVTKLSYKNLIGGLDGVFGSLLVHLLPMTKISKVKGNNSYKYPAYKWIRRFILNKPVLHRVYEILTKNRITIYKQSLPLQQRKKGSRYRTVGRHRLFKSTLTKIPFDRITPYIYLNDKLFKYLNSRILFRSLLYIYSKYPIYKTSVGHHSKDFKYLLKLYKVGKRNILKRRKKFFRKIQPTKNKSYFFLRLRKIIKLTVYRPTYWKQKLLYPLLNNWITNNNSLHTIKSLYQYKSFYGKLKLDVILASKAVIDPDGFKREYFKDVYKLKNNKKRFLSFLARDLYGFQKVGQSYFYYLSDFFRRDQFFKKIPVKGRKKRVTGRKKKFKKQFFIKNQLKNPYKKQVYLNSLFKALIIYHLQKLTPKKNYQIFYEKLSNQASHIRMLYGFLYKTDKNRSFTRRRSHYRREGWIKLGYNESLQRFLRSYKKKLKPKKRFRRYGTFRRYLKLKLMGFYNYSLDDWHKFVQSFGGYDHPTHSNKNDRIIRLPHHLKGFAVSSRLTIPREKKKGVHPYRYSRIKKRVAAFRSIFRPLFHFINSRRRSRTRLSKETTRMNKTRYSYLNNLHFFLAEIINYYKINISTENYKTNVLLAHPVIQSFFKNKISYFLTINKMTSHIKNLIWPNDERLAYENIRVSTFIYIVFDNLTQLAFKKIINFSENIFINTILVIASSLVSFSYISNNLANLKFKELLQTLGVTPIWAFFNALFIFFKILKGEKTVSVLWFFLNGLFIFLKLSKDALISFKISKDALTLNNIGLFLNLLWSLPLTILLIINLFFYSAVKLIFYSFMNYGLIFYRTIMIDKRYGRRYSSSLISNFFISFVPQLHRRIILYLLKVINLFKNLYVYIVMFFYYFKSSRLPNNVVRVSNLMFYHLYYVGVFRLPIPKGWMTYFYYLISNYIEDIYLDLDTIYSYPLLRNVYSPTLGVRTFINLIESYIFKVFYGEWVKRCYLIPFKEYYLFFLDKLNPIITILNNIILWPIAIGYHWYQGTIHNFFYETRQFYYGFTELAVFRIITFLNKSETIARYILLSALWIYNIVLYTLGNLYMFFVWLVTTFNIMRNILNIVIQREYPRSHIGGYIYYASTEEELAGTMYMIIMIVVINIISIYITYVRPVEFLSNLHRIYYIIREPTSIGFGGSDSHIDLRGNHLIRDTIESIIARYWYYRVKLISRLYYSYKNLYWHLYEDKLEAMLKFQYKIDTLVLNKTSLSITKFFEKSNKYKMGKTTWIKSFPYVVEKKKWKVTYYDYLHSILYSAMKRAKMFEFRPNKKYNERVYPLYKILKRKSTISNKDPIVDNYIKKQLNKSKGDNFFLKILEKLHLKKIYYLGQYWKHEYHSYYTMYSKNWWATIIQLSANVLSYFYTYFIKTIGNILKYTILVYSLVLSLPVVLLLPFKFLDNKNYIKISLLKLDNTLIQVTNTKKHIESILWNSLDYFQRFIIGICLIFVRLSIVFLDTTILLLSKISYWYNVGFDEVLLKIMFERTTELYLLSSDIKIDKNKALDYYQHQLWLWYFIINNIINGIIFADYYYFKQAYRAFYILIGSRSYYIIIAPSIYLFIYLPTAIYEWIKIQFQFILFGEKDMWNWLAPSNKKAYDNYKYNDTEQQKTKYKLAIDDFYKHEVFKDTYYEHITKNPYKTKDKL